MWIIYSLAAAICAALVVVLSKAGIKNLDSTLVFGIESICIAIVTWSVIFAKNLQKQFTGINHQIWIFILSAGILTALSSLFSFYSLKIGHASRTSAFEKVSLIFSTLLCIVFLKEKFNWQLGVGIMLILAGILFVAFSDTSG